MEKIVIDKEKCKGCGLCIGVCPKQCLELSKDLNKTGYHSAVFTSNEKCTSCGFCYQICPDICIEVYK